MHEIISQFYFFALYIIIKMWRYSLLKKTSLLLLSPPPGGFLTEYRHFSFEPPPLCKLTTFYWRPERSLGLQAFLFMNVSTQDRYFWSYIKSLINRKAHTTNDLSVYQNKAVILHKGGGVNEKRLFPVKQPPEGGESNRRLLFFNNF